MRRRRDTGRPRHWRHALACVLAACLALPACIVGGTRPQRTAVEASGFPLLNFETRPGAYGAATTRDLRQHGRATIEHFAAAGEACRFALSTPIFLHARVPAVYAAFEDGSYARAYKRAYTDGKRAAHGADGTLIDVKADMHSTIVLTFFYYNCLELRARYAVAKIVPAAAPTPAPVPAIPVATAATATPAVETPATAADTVRPAPPATPVPLTTP